MSNVDRKRVSIACTSCRRRKRRCDGQKPTCGLCEKEARQCEYTHHLEKRKPPTKCYIHALHSRIALLEDQLAQFRHGSNGRPTPPNILEEPCSIPSLSFPQNDPNDLPFFGPESRSSSAYGHLGSFREFDKVPKTSQRKISIVDGVLLVENSAIFLQPGLQTQILEDFWTWQNTWPLLIHEPLFRKGLSDNCAEKYCTPTLLASLLALSAHNAEFSRLELSNFDWNASRCSLVQHAKSSVLEQIEHPSLSLVLSAALISQLELLAENIASASQYIGIAIRHAIALGLHIQNWETEHLYSGPRDIIQARSIAWAGVWMLEKHITRVLGQPSAIREHDMQPISIQILPSVEYCLWPAAGNPSIPKLTSYCMSNFQLSCDLLQIVTPALDKIFAISSSVSFEEKEDQVTKTHVAMSEFYNNLPSPLRLPSAATKQLPPHVYQFNLLYQALKIMLHRPFIRGIPTMESLHTLQNSHLVHLQSATFSAIRVSYIINSFRNFYPLHRLSPMAIESLVLASQIHLFNSKSTDGRLVKRSNDLYRLNLHILNLKTPPGKQSSRAVGTLVSLAQEGEPLLVSDQVKSLAPGNGVDPEEIGSSDISPPAQVFPATIDDLNTAVEPEEKSNLSDVSLWPESYFDWLDLPLNDQLLFDGAFADLLWNDTCDEGHEYCGLTDHTF